MTPPLEPPSAGLVLAGGNFQPLTSFTSARDILVTGTGFIFTGGQNLTLTGNITSQTTAPVVIKAGLGDLTLTGVNTFSSGFQNGESTPTVRATAQNGAQTPGRTILRGPNGSMPLAASVLSIGGGEFVMDNATDVNQNRIGSVTLGLIGGNARLIGNAGQSVTEAVGSVSIGNANNQYGGTLTVEQPDTGASPDQVTTLNATTFTSQAVPSVGTLFVRGTNLGAGTTAGGWGQGTAAVSDL